MKLILRLRLTSLIMIPNKDRPPHNVTLYGRTDEHGKAVVPFNPPSDAKGYYNYVVSAKDEKGREITAIGSFFAGNTEDYYYGRSGGLEIVTDKDAYEKGDSLSAFVFLPQPGMLMSFLTYESSQILLNTEKYILQATAL